MKKIRAVLRLLYFALRTFNEIVVLVVVSIFKGIDVNFALRRRKRYANHLYPIMGIRSFITGTPPDFPCVLMGNHRCYLDPAIVVSDVLGFPVAKAEVEKWPLIGKGAKLTGVLYLKRENKNSRKKTLDGISDKIDEGYPVILYPEGTTGDQALTMPFRLGAFKLAVEKNIPIVPMAIEYGNERDYWAADAPNFILHFLDRFGEPRMYIWLRYGKAMTSDDPQDLLERAQAWINGQIVEMKEERDLFMSKLN